MNIEELRIGNICQWGQLASMGTGIFNINIGSLNYAKFIEPIPITDDWMVKFGFNRVNNHPFEEFIYSKYVRDGITIGLSPKFELYNGIYSQKVSTVHQLQNLYFALTGKELKL